MYLRLLPLLLVALLSSTVVGQTPANTENKAMRDQLLADVAKQLSEHFKLEGELQLDPIRAWNPPTVTD